MKRLVYIDSGVLIAAIRGTDDVASKAFEIFNDPDLSFASSDFVKLETLPQAIYNKKGGEVNFYNEYFDNVQVWAKPNKGLTSIALDEASRNGLRAMDALHVAAAILCNADELITIEKPTTLLHRISSIPVRTIVP